MRTRTREIARVGIFGSKDDPQVVTERDLLEIAETFAEIKSAPVTFGHWADAESPRLGNVVSVSYDAAAKSLLAEINEEDALADAVDAGYYPDASIRSKQRASDGKMYLVHLAYLGQEAPAVKALVSNIKEPLGIAASEAAGIRAFPCPSGKRLFLSDTPPETQKKFNDISSKTEKPPEAGMKQPTDKETCSCAGGGVPAQAREEAFSMTDEEAKKLREENERLKAEAQAKDLALSEAANQRREAARERLKAVMDEKGIPKPVQEKALRLSDSFEDGKAIELSDTEAPEGKRKASQSGCLIEILSAFARPVETGALNLSDGGDAGSAAAAGRVKFSAI
ncbi:MAG: hypothetical protein FWH38_09455 [Treponema sp.]|nr:hypothetical protein [Treponema sp.]